MQLTEEQWQNIRHGIVDVYFEHIDNGEDEGAANYMKDIYYLDRVIGGQFEDGAEIAYVPWMAAKTLRWCFWRLLDHYMNEAHEETLSRDPDELDDCSEAIRSLCVYLGVDKILNV